MKPTIKLLDPVLRVTCGRALKTLLGSNEGALQHGHDPVQKTVDNFKTAGLSVPCGREMSFVATLTLQLQVFERHVANLEDLHGHRVMLVLTDRLQETRDEAGTDDLELQSLGVGKLNSSVTVILAVEPGEVFVMRTQDQRQSFRPASHGRLCSDDVGEFVNGERLADGAGDVGERSWELVETVGNGGIFHDVRLMKHVRTSRWDIDVN